MYISIITIPLSTSIIVGLLGRYFGNKGSVILIIMSIFISCIFSIIGFYEIIICNSSVSIIINNFIKEDIIDSNIELLYDSVSISFIITIVIVSFNVFVFTINYMNNDSHIIRFIVYMCLFSSSMIFLVSSNNYINNFIGWEYIGVFSYFLINYWNKRINAGLAAIKAFTLNRMGDVFFTSMLVIMNSIIGDSNYEISIIIENLLCNDIIYYIGITIILSSIVKSAQFGFHIWLPYSMEGIILYYII